MHYNDAQTLFQTLPAETPLFARLLVDMGTLAARENRLKEAEAQFLRARGILERSVGQDSAHMARCQFALALALSRSEAVLRG